MVDQLLPESAEIPAAIRRQMRDALDRASGTSGAEQLGRAAAMVYRNVICGSGDREDALPLLAADALLTRAFETAADESVAAVESLANGWSDSGEVRELVSCLDGEAET